MIPEGTRERESPVRWGCGAGGAQKVIWSSSPPDAGILALMSLTGAHQPQSVEVGALPGLQPWLALHCQLDVLSLIMSSPPSLCQALGSTVVSWQDSLEENLEGTGRTQLRVLLRLSFSQLPGN